MKGLLVNTKEYPSMPFTIFAGPCSVESLSQMDKIAQVLVKNKIQFVRGGAFKPRTSPYDFQGLGIDGLKILDEIRNRYNLKIVSEIMDTRDIEIGIRYTDMIQIGSRNMQNTPLLKEVGRSGHPVLLKRGMMSTLREFLLAAEYIVAEGNENIMLCERGIRTFEDSTRNTLDISSVAIVKLETSLPIIVDISHSLGRKDIAVPITKAVKALGADGIMVEVHDNPPQALSDARQQFSIDEFQLFLNSIE